MRQFTGFIILLMMLVSPSELFSQSEVAVLRVANNKYAVASDRLSSANHRFPVLFSRNQIWLPGTVGERRGYFMLDTGAPTLLLSTGETINTQNVISGRGVHGSVHLEPHRVSSFSLNGVAMGPQSAYRLSLGHFERRSGLPLLGMLGYEQVRDKEIFFDLQHEYLRIQAANQDVPADVDLPASPLVDVRLRFDQHLPIATLRYGRHKLRFGIDTGAGVNLIDPRSLASFDRSDVTQQSPVNVAGLGGDDSDMLAYALAGLSIGSQSLGEVMVVAQDLSHLRADAGPQLDGIIGLELLSRFVFSIDFRHRRLRLWSVSGADAAPGVAVNDDHH